MTNTANLRAATLLLAALLGAACAGCGGAVRHPPPAITSDTTIVAFGDSLTAGTGAASGQDFPSLLSGILGCRVINEGKPGELSAEGLARLPGVLDRHRPGLLILCHGGNDLLRRYPDEDTARHLDAMIGLSLDRGVPVVVLAVPRPGLRMRPPSFYGRTASARGVVLVEDALRDVLSKAYLKSDLIHPNNRGNRVLADAIAAALRDR